MPRNIYCISSATQNIIMKVPQKIPISIFLVALVKNGISIVIFWKAPGLEYIFRDIWFLKYFQRHFFYKILWNWYCLTKGTISLSPVMTLSKLVRKDFLFRQVSYVQWTNNRELSVSQCMKTIIVELFQVLEVLVGCEPEILVSLEDAALPSR